MAVRGEDPRIPGFAKTRRACSKGLLGLLVLIMHALRLLARPSSPAAGSTTYLQAASRRTVACNMLRDSARFPEGRHDHDYDPNMQHADKVGLCERRKGQ